MRKKSTRAGQLQERPANDDRRLPRRGVRPWLLMLVYPALALAPLVLAWPHEPFGDGPLIDDIASALGMVAFAALLVEFLFSGRHRWISGRIGVAGTIRIHRWVAFGIIAFIVVHPFLYAAPDGDSWPWFNAADPTLSLNAWSLSSGLAAWILTAAMVLTAIDRHALSWRYETWRNTHVLGALVLAALVAFHALTAPGHSGQMPLLAYWLVLLGAAGLVLAELFVLRPSLQRRRPYVVETVDRIGDRTWALYLRPESGPDGSVMRFRPGQFAWVKLGGRAFATRDHPFSMSTAPTEGSSIGFTIKEKGDFTDRIGEIATGTRAYLDGPHGHLVPDDQPVATVYIAAGTGIGPVMSHLRSFRLDGDSRRLTLIYSVSSDKQIPERAELDRMAEVLDLTVHYVVQHPSSRWRGAMGLIDAHLLDACLPHQGRAVNRYFVCGPDRMIKSVYAALRALGIPARRVLTGS